MVAELVRRASFPDRPSRFTSLFGTTTLHYAQRFRAGYGESTDRIFRVSCDRSFRCDMDLLRSSYSVLGAWLLATKYWNGEQGPNPLWEELMVPPVRKMDRVD